MGQFLLQSAADNTKRGNFFYKVGKVVKLGQFSQSRAVQLIAMQVILHILHYGDGK